MSGAPLPVVLSDDVQLILCYGSQRRAISLGTSIQLVGKDTEFDAVAVATFELYKIYQFGGPNEESLSGHPLYGYGLAPGTARTYRVKFSPWIRQLERMNSVHPNHAALNFDELTHYIFTFEDRTFECVARSVSFELTPGSLRSVASEQLERLLT
jgi:hypothetical protein